MYLLIPFLPLLAFFVAATFGRYIGRKGSTIITTTCIFLTAVLSTIAFYEVALTETNCYVQVTTWIDSAILHASWGFLFDSLTVIMLIVVTYVSAVVHLYSIEYMAHDPHIQRFMSYLSLFTFFMIILVTADNFIQMFIGWEGVGLASFLLINFWTTRLQANKAAMKALIVNRVGDFGLSLGIFAIFFVFGAVDYSTVFASASDLIGYKFFFLHMEFDALTVICLLIFIGAVGKSAQIGLHTWLPDAMEGPTPVSALIHAATMVTAGVFLIVRCSPLYEYAPSTLVLITFIGALTSFFAATTGAFQNDLKRVIAYSTCSQLGYMVFACGLSSYSVTMFHLMNHAFFKALLFLSAGSIIHAMHDEQDMRRMGALNRILPFTYTATLIGSFALIGFPFLTGYYSKDFILEIACSKLHFMGVNNLAYWLGTITVSFTTFYSYRLVFLTFLSKNNSFKQFICSTPGHPMHEANILMGLPLVLLAFGSLFVGYLTKDMIIGLGSPFWGQSLFALSSNIVFLEAEYLPYHVKLIPFVFSHIGIFFAYHTTAFFLAGGAFGSTNKSASGIGQASLQKSLMFYRFCTQTPIVQAYSFFNQKWHFDDFYNRFIVQKVLSFGYHTSFRLLDLGWIAYLGPYGIARATTFFSKTFSKLQTGFVYHYAFIILIAITLLLLILLAGTWGGAPFWGNGSTSAAVTGPSDLTLHFIFIISFCSLSFA
uniref:NADH-ubiquinone oxidoreductase chain 5 n=1 Tax=Marophrys sp. SRT127 TaxID=2488311 RepID=A0A455RE83_9EUKA|nr:NADH dehydrogenase subunit 5 [Marophrys sp. SRT127]